MDEDEIYAERIEAKHQANRSASALADEAYEAAEDSLQDDIGDLETGEANYYLQYIANIVFIEGSTAEKYGLISDIFLKMIDQKYEKNLGR